MTPLSITTQQVNYINYLLSQLCSLDHEQYLKLIDFPTVSNNFTWFLKQQSRGFVYDLNRYQGTYMIDTLKHKLNIF